MRSARAVLRSRAGQAMFEYALLLALVATALLVILVSYRSHILNIFASSNTALTATECNAGGSCGGAAGTGGGSSSDAAGSGSPSGGASPATDQGAGPSDGSSGGSSQGSGSGPGGTEKGPTLQGQP
jgi:Flp pilus assembly pilin Flp